MKTISDEYLELNRELHNRNQKYGGKGDAWADRVLGYIADEGAASYLDYGCGKGNLLNEVRSRRPDLIANGYDPVTMPGDPKPAEFVTANDVLEHIEMKYLYRVLAHIASLTEKRALLVISQRLANKRLADGRNAHLIVKPTSWWMPRLKEHFREVVEVDPIKPSRVGIELAVLVRP